MRKLALVVEGGRDGPQPRFPASGRGDDDERSWVQQACESCCLYLERLDITFRLVQCNELLKDADATSIPEDTVYS